MKIVRTPRPEMGYYVGHKMLAHLLEGRLSCRAFGLLVALLAMPDGRETSTSELAKTMTEGRDALRSALRELASANFARVSTEHDDRGRISTVVFVYDEPQVEWREDGIYKVEADGTEVAVVPPPSTGAISRPGGLSANEIAAQVRDVFEYWAQRKKNRALVLMTDARQRAITKAVKSYGPDTVKAAIDGLYLSEFHVSRGLTDITYALRETNFDRFVEAAQDRTSIPDGSQGQRAAARDVEAEMLAALHRTLPHDTVIDVPVIEEGQ